VTASELAFLGLGLLLGAATGAAVIVVLGSRSPRREIRVTVTRDALPRRSETLSQDAFITSPSAPAPGGPGDRRWFDRDLPPSDPRGSTGVPVMSPVTDSGRVPVAPRWTPATDGDRTAVPYLASSAAPAVAVASRAETDGGLPIRPEPSADPSAMPTDTPRLAPPGQSRLERILRGEHLAMLEVVDAVAGQDSLRRRDWEVLLGALVEGMAEVAVQESVVDFPMGTAFWDTFTVEQCRQIVAALATMGFQYDGRAGWVEHHVPVYRDLSIALADIGVDPRRVRAWPNQAEIAALFVGARPAPEELLAAAGPEYRASDVQALLGVRATDLAGLWNAWDAVRAVLLAEVAPAQREADRLDEG
jgi:hypothetical protein